MANKILFNVNDVNKPTPIPTESLPVDFPKFTVTGESAYNGDFFITPHTTKDFTSNYIFSIDRQGNVLFYKKVTNQAYDFKKVRNSKGQVRYTYLDVISKTEPTEGNVGFYENSELVVLNEFLEEIDRKRFEANGEIPEGYPAENHFSLYIDDGHYIVASYFKPEGSNKYENAIQEIKWGTDIWHWETNDTPELASLSHTTPTGDYAHINALRIDYDGNFVISFRNIGIVKLNKETKEVMWVIGRNRNDFTGLDSALIPFQQHDIRILLNDGSMTLFDNYGHTSKSRVLRYWLNQDTMTCEKAEEYLTTKDRSNYMGSAQIVDANQNIYDITYGSGWNFGFEEYDFTQNKQLMQFTFNDGHDLYNVTRDLDELAASFNGGNTPALPPDVLPEPYYRLEGEIFDGTKVIDTKIKLFDQNKDFSIIVKYSFDKDYLTSLPSNAYEVIFHNMYEETPWNGITCNTVRNTTISQSVDCNLGSAVRATVIKDIAIANIPDTIIIVFTYSTNGDIQCGSYLDDGTIYTPIVNLSSTYKDLGDYKNQNLYIGAADMLGTFDRYFVGTLHKFEVYNQSLTQSEIEEIIKI